jgi:hypothetical protein
MKAEVLDLKPTALLYNLTVKEVLYYLTIKSGIGIKVL